MLEVLEIAVSEINQEPFAQNDIHSHLPYTSSYNNNDEIRIVIQNQEQCLLPSRSYLHVQGRISQENGDKIVAGTTLVTNAICFLFSEIRYNINSVTIDTCRNVGITTIMKGYPSFNQNQFGFLQVIGWDKENIIDAKGNFDVLIPLKMLFGFAEDFQKIVCNVKHELIITRNNSDMNTIVQTAEAANSENNSFKFTLNKIEWLMPHLTPSNEKKAQLLNFLSKRPTLKMQFRSWELYEYPRLPLTNKHVWTVKTSNHLEKPQYIILGFQTSVSNNRKTDASVFKHCNVMNAKVFLNSQFYPYNNLNLNFKNGQYSLLYEMFLNFQSSYYGKRNFDTIVNKKSFEDSSPLFIFDCTCQNESIKYGAVDVRIEFETTENVLDETTAFCLIIHDRLVEYKPLEGDVKIIS